MSGFAQKLVYYKTSHNGDVVGITLDFFHQGIMGMQWDTTPKFIADSGWEKPLWIPLDGMGYLILGNPTWAKDGPRRI